MAWRIDVLRPRWRPSHEIREHHFDRQPVFAYLPGLLAVAGVAYINNWRQKTKDEVETHHPGEDRSSP